VLSVELLGVHRSGLDAAESAYSLGSAASLVASCWGVSGSPGELDSSSCNWP